MIYVIGHKDVCYLNESKVVNTTSHSNDFGRQLSPFILGPVDLYDGYVYQNVENGWQFSKTYARFLDPDNDEYPNEQYFEWAKKGWDKKWADRYPMGKGAQPAYSFWNGKKLSYIEARKAIYIPLYSRCVRETDAFKTLEKKHSEGEEIYLLDFDGYNHKKIGMNYDDVVNCEKKKMGHAFVIAMLLDGYLG